jgi:hypothetical protein
LGRLLGRRLRPNGLLRRGLTAHELLKQLLLCGDGGLTVRLWLLRAWRRGSSGRLGWARPWLWAGRRHPHLAPVRSGAIRTGIADRLPRHLSRHLLGRITLRIVRPWIMPGSLRIAGLRILSAAGIARHWIRLLSVPRKSIRICWIAGVHRNGLLGHRLCRRRTLRLLSRRLLSGLRTSRLLRRRRGSWTCRL